MNFSQSIKMLALSAVIMAACTAAWAGELNAPMKSSDIITVGENGRHFVPEAYSQFARFSGAAIDFEVQVIKSGLLSDIADKSLSSLIGQPSYKLDYIVGKDFQTSGHRIAPPDTALVAELSLMTAGSLIENTNAYSLQKDGSYRVFQVSMRVNGARYWYEALELCRSSCLIADLVIPSLEADASHAQAVADANETEAVNVAQPTSELKPVGDKTTFKWVLNSTVGTTNQAVRQWTMNQTTIKVGAFYNRSSLTKGKTEARLSCDTAGNIASSYNAEASSFIPGAGSGYKGDCAFVEDDGGRYDNNRAIRVLVMSGCAYASKGFVSYDALVSGSGGTFTGDLKASYTNDSGVEGTAKNGWLIKDRCVLTNIN